MRKKPMFLGLSVGRSCFFSIFLLLVFVFFPSCRKENSGRFPNVILISIDTLRSDHLGCYGYSKPTSPNIDAFAQDSVLFEMCMAQAPSTLPSHASIFTSLIPSHHSGFFTRKSPISPQVYTITDILKLNGFQTVSFNGRGQVAGELGFQRGFDIYEGTSHIYSDPADFTFDKKVESTRQWLREKKEGSFFLFLHTYQTHHPYTPRDGYLEIFETDYQGELPDDISVELIQKINNKEMELSPADQQHIVNAYDAEIRDMDDAFGELIAILKEEGLYRNSLIIFTSDHGEEFGEHGIFATHSHTLFNELLHVPLLIKFPRSRHRSQKIKFLCRGIDVLPTVLDVLKIDVDAGFEGESLLPAIEGKKELDVYVVAQRDMLDTYLNANWTIMNRKWKLYDDNLYDLENDPGEQRPLKNQQLQTYLEEMFVAILQKEQQPEDRKEKRERLEEQLRALGYIK